MIITKRGKTKSPGSAIITSRSESLTLGGRELNRLITYYSDQGNHLVKSFLPLL